MLHSLQGRFEGRRWKGLENFLNASFHGLRFGVLCGLNVEGHRSRESTGISAKQADRSGHVTWLDDQRREPINPADNLGELAQHRLEFLNPRMEPSGVFEREVRGCAVSLL